MYEGEGGVTFRLEVRSLDFPRANILSCGRVCSYSEDSEFTSFLAVCKTGFNVTERVPKLGLVATNNNAKEGQVVGGILDIAVKKSICLFKFYAIHEAFEGVVGRMVRLGNNKQLTKSRVSYLLAWDNPKARWTVGRG